MLGFRLMCEVFNVSPGTVHSCADILKEGHVLGISPGKFVYTSIISGLVLEILQ
jgi:hypothetical protein